MWQKIVTCVLGHCLCILSFLLVFQGVLCLYLVIGIQNGTTAV